MVFSQEAAHIVKTLDLDEVSKECILRRYVKLLALYEKKLWRASCIYYVSQVTMQVGSLLTPALLTYRSQNLEDITWGVALGTGVITSLFNVFSVGKKYAALVQTYSLLSAEGAIFMQGCGRYSALPRFEAANLFVERVEGIHSKFVKKDASALSAARSSFPRMTRANAGNDTKVKTPPSVTVIYDDDKTMPAQIR
jgi:hypothetical protein